MQFNLHASHLFVRGKGEQGTRVGGERELLDGDAVHGVVGLGVEVGEFFFLLVASQFGNWHWIQVLRIDPTNALLDLELQLDVAVVPARALPLIRFHPVPVRARVRLGDAGAGLADLVGRAQAARIGRDVLGGGRISFRTTVGLRDLAAV